MRSASIAQITQFLNKISWLQAPFFGWLLGLMTALAYILWLALPSRLPALAVLGVVAIGTLARHHHKLKIKGEYVALVFILSLAALLRLVGLSQNLPYFDNPDEPTLTNAAIKMLQTGDLNPHFFRWPSLPFYLQFGISIPQFLAGISNGSIVDLQTLPTAPFMLAGRLVSALFGIATTLVTYLVGRTLYNPNVGLFAALSLAVLPLHSEHSHYITPDVQVTFWATLTLLFAALIVKNGSQRWYLWAGVAAGLTTSTKYNVGAILFVIVLAYCLAESSKRRILWLSQAIGLAGLAFILTSPFAILDLTGFLNEIAFQVRHYTILGHGSASEGASWSAYLRDFWNEGLVGPASLIALASMGFLLIRQRREDWLIVTWPLVAYFFFSAAKVHFARNLLPLLPALAIASAVFLLSLIELAPKWRIQLACLVWLIIYGFSLSQTIATDRYYLQPDTRQNAAQWILANIPSGSKLRMEPNTPILPNRYQNAQEQRPIGAHPPAWYQTEGYHYLVASSYCYDELIRTDQEAAANYVQIAAKFELIQEFKGGSNTYPGPTIQIYRVIR